MKNTAQSMAIALLFSLAINLYGGEINLVEARKSCPELFEFKQFSSDRMIKVGIEEAPVQWLKEHVAGFDRDVSIKVVKKEGTGAEFILKESGILEILIPIGITPEPDKVHGLAWSRLVYGLLIRTHSDSIKAATEQYRKGEVDDEAVLDFLKHAHFEATKDIKNFFSQVWRPWAIKNGAIPINSTAWFVFADTSDYASWLLQQKNNGNIDLLKKWVNSQK